MSLAEYGPYHEFEIPAKIEADVSFIKNSFSKSPDKIRSAILWENEYNVLVRDAMEELDYFYDGTILPEQDIIYPLLAAQNLPSERNRDADTTVIRLLHPLYDQIEGFKAKPYGIAVDKGVQALRREPGQTFEEYLDKVDKADTAAPYLKLADTVGKEMLLVSLSPVQFPADFERQAIMQVHYGDLFGNYEASFTTFFNKPDRRKWPARIRKGMESGRAALQMPPRQV